MMRLLTIVNLSILVSSHEQAHTSPPSTISAWYHNSSSSNGAGLDGPSAESSSSDNEGLSLPWVPPTIERNMGEKTNPMKTLEKLQEMLDDTDYLMNRRSLWTSRDRSKYKRQQKRFRKMEDDESDETTDDGLSYTLPDLPIYNSDVEDESNAEDMYQQRYQQNQYSAQHNHETSIPPQYQHGDQQSPQQNVPPRSFHQHSPQIHRPPVPPANTNQYIPPPPQNKFSHGPSEYSPYSSTPPYQSNYEYRANHYQYPEYKYPPPYPPPRYQSYPYDLSPAKLEKQNQQAPTVSSDHGQANDLLLEERSWSTNPPTFVPRKTFEAPKKAKPSGMSPLNRDLEISQMPNYPIIVEEPSSFHSMKFDNSVESLSTDARDTLVEASTDISIWSFLKISHLALMASLLAYAAVSPRSLPLTEYNLQFYENLRLILLAGIAPSIYMLLVFNARFNDINAVTHSFFATASLGYILTFSFEVLTTTILRLIVFCVFERGVFRLTPQVPIPILPWVLKDRQYRPKRITILVADFVTSCILCPVIEETMKFILLQWTVALPKNFRWITKYPSKKKRKRRIAEPIVRKPGENDCVNANPYITQMLAVSMALKLADVTRRVLLYTKPTHANKGFYAICRGLFPIQELCGTMTALGLAKRDLLGFHIPIWKLLAPAIVVHGMANFRGMKPIFKWNSSTPWSEMQLSPLNVPDASSFFQLLKKGYAKLMWLIILSRVFGYCVKNFYMVNRQALKRTTKYAGNQAAFFAELTTAETLKSQKKK